MQTVRVRATTRSPGSFVLVLVLALVLALLGAACGGDDDGAIDAGDVDGAAADGSAVTDAALPDGPYAATTAGPVMGSEDGDLHVFLGIPYAEPPVGDLRFRPPVPHGPWTDTRAATAFGPVCPQRNGTPPAYVGDEDCLTLNVWTFAERATPRPVMVFVHGGGFVQGASSDALYDGASLARAGDVLVVTLNYRLGGLGFLATEALATESGDGSAGNYGIRDQVLALAWVRDNIAAFGGDPANVTIFGESAGAVSVCAHLASPLSTGLFHRAIQESGGGCYSYALLRTTVAGRPSAVSRGDELLASLGCDAMPDPLACARAATAEDVVTATWALGASGLGLPDIGPNVDGVVLTDQPFDVLARGEGADVPFIVGSNADEAVLFTSAIPIPDDATYQATVRATLPLFADDLLALYPAADFASPKAAFNAMFSDVAFICPAVSLAGATASGAPSHAYHFTKTLEGTAAIFGSPHGLELPYVFDTVATLDRYSPTAADATMVDSMQLAWTSFARAGAPTTTPAWPAFDAASPTFMILDQPLDTATSIRNDRCAELVRIGVVR